MEDSLVTFAEIMEYTHLSHNSVTKKMRKLGIKYASKAGHTMLYTRSDMERINGYRPLPYKPGTIFYRVSVQVGSCWFVTEAGLPISRAKSVVENDIKESYRKY